jgi:prophage tail gpP-like protein
MGNILLRKHDGVRAKRKKVKKIISSGKHTARKPNVRSEKRHYGAGKEVSMPETTSMEPVQGKSYSVKSGDNLRKIATAAYGRESEWLRIYRANKDIIGDDPDFILPGQTILIPAEEVIQEALAPVLEIPDQKSVTVFLGGRELLTTQGRFAYSVDSMASSWNCDILWNPGDDPDLDTVTARGSYAESQIYFFGKLVGSGRLYTRTTRVNTDSITKNLVFYSHTKDIVDSSLSPHHPEYSKSTIKQIADDICKDLGFRAKFPDGPGGAFDLIEGIPAYETIGKFFQKLAAARGLFVSCDETSALVFQKIHDSGTPVAHIDMTGRIATQYETVYDDTLRFHNYVAVGQAGDGKIMHSRGFFDSQVPATRQFVFAAGDLDSAGLDGAAQWAMLKINLQAAEIKIPTDRWTDDNGDLWKPNTVVTLKSPVLDTPDARKYVIRGVEFAWTASTRSAQLSLVPILSVDGSGRLVME